MDRRCACSLPMSTARSQDELEDVEWMYKEPQSFLTHHGSSLKHHSNVSQENSFCTHEFYYSSLVLSITISLIAVAIFSVYLARSTLLATLGIMALAASKSFVDFSTSGLENPLTYLLIVIFMLVFYRGQRKEHYLFW